VEVGYSQESHPEARNLVISTVEAGAKQPDAERDQNLLKGFYCLQEDSFAASD